VAVAEASSFTAAARRLGVSVPHVTRAVMSLELRLGVKLLHRTTRVVRLSESGVRYLSDCKRLLGELEDAEASLTGAQQEPRGQLGVTASVMFGRMYVAPVLLGFLAGHPKLTARALLVDRIVDLFEEGLDVAVRIARLPDSPLTAIRVGSVRRVACASPAFLARHGVPKTPTDLSQLPAIAFGPDRATPSWAFEGSKRRFALRPRSQLVVNSSEVAIEAALSGHGVTRVLSYMIGRELADGRLQIVLSDFEPAPLPIHVLYSEGRRAAARVRAFVDHLVPRLRADRVLNPTNPRGPAEPLRR
jgi:DNA-binding transcriptional LysR family regulator